MGDHGPACRCTLSSTCFTSAVTLLHYLYPCIPFIYCLTNIIPTYLHWQAMMAMDLRVLMMSAITCIMLTSSAIMASVSQTIWIACFVTYEDGIKYATEASDTQQKR